jgi:lipopolysaccharide/colanic/teichoic acid biosynthesis glycosyltransferase
VSDRPAQGPYRGKRTFDLVVLGVVALPAVAIGTVCALAVKLTSKGPVFFRQERVGLGSRAFEIVKFRTMVHAPEGNPIFPDAQRITPVGHVLRRLSLDELPQLINVARGEMSIVGPRPTLAYQVARYTPTQRQRLCVRPGVTGLAQVRGRNRIDWAARIELDLEYIRRQSPTLDLRILVESVGVILRGSGVSGHPLQDPLAEPPQ